MVRSVAWRNSSSDLVMRFRNRIANRGNRNAAGHTPAVPVLTPEQDRRRSRHMAEVGASGLGWKARWRKKDGP